MRAEGEGAASGARTSLLSPPLTAQSITGRPAEQSSTWLLGRVVPQFQAQVMTIELKWQTPMGVKFLSISWVWI